MSRIPLPCAVLLAALCCIVACSSNGDVDEPDASTDADTAPADVEDDAEMDVLHEPDADADASSEPDVAPPEYDIASGPLAVGYARVEAPWRVGAKPGQVGTEAHPGLESTLGSLLSPLASTLLHEPDPAVVLQEATEWTIDLLEEEAENTHHGEFSNWFEPGVGIEEPPDIKAMVIERGDLKVAVVRADIYLMHEYLHRTVAELVAEDTGLDRDQIFLAGTHNHSAPQPSSPAPGVWSLADGYDPRHFVYLTEKIAEAIRQADDDRRPARLRTKRTEYSDVQFNIIGPSTIEFAPDDESEEEEIQVGYPYEYFDSDLDLLYFDDAEAPHEPIALMFSLGMHPETLPNHHGLTSGDFPIHTEKRFQKATDVPAMWLPGALGDIEPDRARNNPDHDFWRHSFGALHQLSTTLAEDLQDHWEEMLDDGDIEPEVEPKLRNISRDIAGTEDYPLPTTAYLMGIRMASPRVLHGSSLVRLQAIRLGDALLLGIPAEVTSDLSYNIKSRVNDENGDVYQGYVYPDNPNWVAERVQQNFSTDEVDADLGAPMPIVTSMVNGYIGYVVSRWEYENREHYRMHMTPHGPESADHLASHIVELVDEMMGGEHRIFAMPEWLDEDLAGVDTLMNHFRGLEEDVAAMQSELPVTEAETVGEVIDEPLMMSADDIDEDHATHDAVAFRWRGATNDMPPPTITVERNVDDQWHPVTSGPGMTTHLFFEEPDQWTARWHPGYTADDIDEADELRFRIHGTFRGSGDGGEVDPIWDPEGADETYEATSASFELGDLGWAQ